MTLTIATLLTITKPCPSIIVRTLAQIIVVHIYFLLSIIYFSIFITCQLLFLRYRCFDERHVIHRNVLRINDAS